MVAPVRGDVLVDHAGALVPDALWVSVGADGPVRRLPDVPLTTRTRVIALDELPPVLVLHHRLDVAVGMPLGRPLDAHPTAVEPVRVAVAVDVDDLVIAEIDAVGTERPGAAVEVRVQHLMSEGDPSARRAAGEEARPWRA